MTPKAATNNMTVKAFVAVGRSDLTCQSGRLLKRAARREVLDNMDTREQNQIFPRCFKSLTNSHNHGLPRIILFLDDEQAKVLALLAS